MVTAFDHDAGTSLVLMASFGYCSFDSAGCFESRTDLRSASRAGLGAIPAETPGRLRRLIDAFNESKGKDKRMGKQNLPLFPQGWLAGEGPSAVDLFHGFPWADPPPGEDFDTLLETSVAFPDDSPVIASTADGVCLPETVGDGSLSQP